MVSEKLRLDFENGTAEIVKLADWDTVKSNIFLRNVQYIRGSPENSSAGKYIASLPFC